MVLDADVLAVSVVSRGSKPQCTAGNIDQKHGAIVWGDWPLVVPKPRPATGDSANVLPESARSWDSQRVPAWLRYPAISSRKRQRRMILSSAVSTTPCLRRSQQRMASR